MASFEQSTPSITFSPALVQRLIEEQFPQWAHLKVYPVTHNGHDNRTFRLGNTMLVRLPSAISYVPQVQKEQKWLPFLGSNLSFLIPTPLAMGQPSQHYPWPWSIYQWIDGQSANNLPLNDLNLNAIALQLSNFLNELHKIDHYNAPPPGEHNYWRGGNLSIYDEETRVSIQKLNDIIDPKKALSIWDQALKTQWTKPPVWIHGDISSGNILIKNKKLHAIIDFGCMGIGDPACDLVIAWNLFDQQARKEFKNNLGLDHHTWERARGWALWKACLEILKIIHTTNPEILKWQIIIEEIFKETY